ncbi:unnamed protein product [Lactuca saligna]|uniref:Ubiquitin-like domain-containing protein n=1 Tax=Lactuca saligna TaxID=75948 RepID=A0AA35Z1I0_LACSI|nr:unnamed protein product [Lactuca saligna]
MTRAIMSSAHTKDQSFGVIQVFLGLQVHEMLSQMNPTLVMSEKNLQDENTKPAPMLISLVLQNYRGHVDHWVESYQVPVPALKEHIASVTAVLSEQQRLIYRGKVLKDDQLLSAYHPNYDFRCDIRVF